MKRLMLAILACAAASSALATDLDLPPGRWWENEHLGVRIGLTDEQRAEIRDLVYEHARRMIDLTAAVRRSELELARVVEPPDFDPASARRAFGGLQDARRALEDQRFEMLLAVRGALTAEQWVTIQELRRAQRRDREYRLGPVPPDDRPPDERPHRNGPRF
jgi:Spy/CpxP family protein refolding chaperone